MDTMARIEQALHLQLADAELPGAPPRLAAALRYAVFPGGARIRPRLCLSVAVALGDDRPALADAGAAAIEILHCASLVHDDLPCFDDAATRRGKPAVHRAFGEPVAVLAGDALIVLAFEGLSQHIASAPRRVAEVMGVVAASVGMPHGIVAGQAWELEPGVGLADYQRAKTGSLFAAAAMAGAAAAGGRASDWSPVGECLGEAYQVADDIRDVVADPQEIGKPVGQDDRHARPSAVARLGLDGARRRLERLVETAIGSIPSCPGQSALREEIARESKRFLPKELQLDAA